MLQKARKAINMSTRRDLRRNKSESIVQANWTNYLMIRGEHHLIIEITKFNEKFIYHLNFLPFYWLPLIQNLKQT